MDQNVHVLPQTFYQSTDVVHLAKQLLGKIVISDIEGKITSGIIVETEAYRGPDDKGCHAYGGRYTERTKTMYATGGTVYVYICYGIHPMFNVVTGPEGDAHAILIRAIEPLTGAEIMQERRNMYSLKPELTNGPGKLAVALGISKGMDGSLMYENNQPLSIGKGNIMVEEKDIISGPRVGMSVHVGPCAHRPWRFYIKDNPWVSKPMVVNYKW
jgi:DNA-3-methyladenine glycosylase